MTTPDIEALVQALEAIEYIAGDDAFDVWCMENAHRKFRGRTGAMFQKLVAIYETSHGFNPHHSCHHSHAEWRARATALVEAAAPKEEVDER